MGSAPPRNQPDGHDLVGPWRLLSLLGGGGMGQVYLAERADGQYQQQVAVKLMREGLDRAGLEARFRAERQILASLDHPNLARLLDGGISAEGVPYFVMELVSGQPIDAYCQDHALSVYERLQLFRTVCQVVHYAHRQGVVHRDLKPANILVTRDGVVKLVDFGIAKQITAPSPATATVQRVMTLEYASPEQVRGEPVTPASDIFSLGVVLYRLLTGASPYPAATTGSDYALSKAICDTEPAPPSKEAATRPLRKQLKGDLDAVVMRALRKDPQHRYASAEALADDVFRHLEGLPVQARRGAWSYRAGRFVLRHRAAVGAALLANIVLVAGLSFAAYEAYQAHQQRQRAERHFASVRKLANVFVFDVDKAIERIPGALKARRTLVTTALGYLEQLNREAGGDPALRLEIAAGYRHIGDVMGAPQMSNIGRPQEAMEHYRRAHALAQPLAEANGPHQLAARHELVLLDTRIGGVLDKMGRFKEAEAAHAEGVRLGELLVQAEPGNYQYQRALGNQLIYQVQMYHHSDAEPQFRAASARAEQQLRRVLAMQPDDTDVVANLAAVYGYRALHFLDDTRAPSSANALAEFEKAIAIMAPAYEKHPDHLVLAPNYAHMHAEAGTALQRLHRYSEALAHQRQALQIKQRLAQHAPGDVRSTEGVAYAQALLAETLIETGDSAAAISAAEQATRGYAALPAAERALPSPQYYEAWSLYLLGNAWLLKSQQARDAASRRAALAQACDGWRRSLPLMVDNDRQQPIEPDKDGPHTVRKALHRCA